MAFRVPEQERSAAKSSASVRAAGQKPVDVSNVSRKETSDVDGFDYESAIEKAESTDNPDGYKYQMAVQLAQNMAGPEIDDDDMRDLVDSEFAKLNPTATGAQMRGEDNVGAQIMGGFNEAKDTVSDAVGSGIDMLWDGIVGTGAGLLGGLVGAFTGDENTGEDWNNAVSGLIGDEEGAIFDTRTLGDIATGIAVSAIPGIGVPLSAGLAIADNSDNIREAATGRDSITRELLDGDERWTKAGSAVLDTALAAAPGVGKLRNATAARNIDDILANSDDLARGISEASTLKQSFRPSNIATIAGDSARSMPSRIASRASGVRDAVSNADGVIGKAGAAIKAARTPTRQALVNNTMMDAIASARGGGQFASAVPGAAAKEAAEGAAKNSGRLGRAANALREAVLPNGIRGALGNAVTSGGMGALSLGNGIINYAAETNQNPYEALGNVIPAMVSNNGGDFGSVLRSLALPIGANAVVGSNRLPGVRGRMGVVNPALRYAQLGAGGEIGSRAGQASKVNSMDADTLAAWIDQLGNEDVKE